MEGIVKELERQLVINEEEGGSKCTKSTLSMYLPMPFIVCGIDEIIGLQN
jgi:hypothetical protein